jgi:branched-chain amino acid aminotransferase
MEVSMKAWIMGLFVDVQNANVNLLSHSFGRGSAIFEVFDIVPAVRGPAFFGITQHIDRLFTSAELTYMDLPMTKEETIGACIEAAKENDVSYGATKLFAYYPGIELDVYPSKRDIHVAIFCLNYAAFGITREALSRPVDVGVPSYRKLHPETMPIHAKVCGSYVNGYLAVSEIKRKGYDDIINIDVNGNIAEGATCSVFLVKDGSLKTARAANVLKGITRMAVIEVADHVKLAVEEVDIPASELLSFDEAFYAVSAKRIQPIRSIEGRVLGDSCPGPITKRVIDAVDEMYSGTNDKFERWLTYIR